MTYYIRPDLAQQLFVVSVLRLEKPHKQVCVAQGRFKSYPEAEAYALAQIAPPRVA